MLNTLLFLLMNVAVMAVIWWSARNARSERGGWIARLVGIQVQPERPRAKQPGRRH